MKLFNTNNYIVKLTSKLKILNAENLKPVFTLKDDTPSSIYVTSDTIHYGTYSGLLKSINIDTKEVTQIYDYSNLKINSKDLNTRERSNPNDNTNNKKRLNLDNNSNKKNKNPTLNSIFFLDKTFYLGYNDGTILILKKSKLFKSYNHSLPILSIISDGINVLVSDMAHKVVNYPTRVSFDIVEPLFIYFKYVFICEKSFLYIVSNSREKGWIDDRSRNEYGEDNNIKTNLTNYNTNINSYLNTDSKIQSLKFNSTGGILFILLYNKIQIWNFNLKTLIKEINCSCINFVFDELRNRLILFYDKKYDIIKDVLDFEYDEMEDVSVDEFKIYEKRVKINQDEEYKQINISGEKYYKINGDEKYLDKSSEDNDNFDYVDEFGDISSEDKEYNIKRDTDSDINKDINNNIFTCEEEYYEDNSNEETNNTETFNSKLKRKFVDDSSTNSENFENNKNKKYKDNFDNKKLLNNTFPIKVKKDSLLFYNDTGYLISLNGPDYDRIELRFHDKLIPSIEYKDYNKCTKGTFYKENILLSNTNYLYFISHGNEILKLELNNKYPVLFSLTSEYIILYNKLTTIYNHRGVCVYNFMVSNITSISCECIKNKEFDEEMIIKKDENFEEENFFKKDISHEEDLISNLHANSISYTINNNKSYVRNIFYVFADHLYKIDLFNKTDIIPIPYTVTWSCIYNNKLYYKMENDVYLLDCKLSTRVTQDVEIPLAVVGNKLVCFKGEYKIVPVPTIEFIDIDKRNEIGKIEDNIKNERFNLFR